MTFTFQQSAGLQQIHNVVLHHQHVLLRIHGHVRKPQPECTGQHQAADPAGYRQASSIACAACDHRTGLYTASGKTRAREPRHPRDDDPWAHADQQARAIAPARLRQSVLEGQSSLHPTAQLLRRSES